MKLEETDLSDETIAICQRLNQVMEMVKPTPEIRNQVLMFLEQVMLQVEAGEISSLIMISTHRFHEEDRVNLMMRGDAELILTGMEVLQAMLSDPNATQIVNVVKH